MLQGTTKDIQKNLERIEELEERRKKIIAHVAQQEKLPAEEVKLRVLAQQWKEPYIEEIRKELFEVLSEVSRLNKKNKAFLEQAQKVNAFMTDLLYSVLQQQRGYNAEGKIERTQGGYFESEI